MPKATIWSRVCQAVILETLGCSGDTSAFHLLPDPLFCNRALHWFPEKALNLFEYRGHHIFGGIVVIDHHKVLSEILAELTYIALNGIP